MYLLTILSVGDISFAGGFTDWLDYLNWINDGVRTLLKAAVVICNLDCAIITDGSMADVDASEILLATPGT